MRICKIHFEGTAPYSQSFRHETPKLAKETDDDYDVRTWREKSHVTDDGRIFIPAMAFKQALDGASKMVGGKIPGRGQATYAKLFVTGVAFFDDVVLGVLKADVGSVRINANSNGIRGAGSRVWRRFPVVPANDFKGVAVAQVLDDSIPDEVFERVVRHAGIAQGVGRFRPENGGMYGRFSVTQFEWQSVTL